MKEKVQGQPSLIDRLKAIDPKREPVWTAPGTLKTPEEIKAFFQEYTDYLAENAPEDQLRRVPAPEMASLNIGYVLSSECSDETIKQWQDAIGEIRHPYFGALGRVQSGEEAYLQAHIDAAVGKLPLSWP